MLIVMDMSSGRQEKRDGRVAAYGDEALNAGRVELPETGFCPALRLVTHAASERRERASRDADGFLANLYASQV